MTGISITSYFHLSLTCFQLHYKMPRLRLLYPPTAFHLSLGLCHPSCSLSGSPVTPAVSLHMTHHHFLSSLLCFPVVLPSSSTSSSSTSTSTTSLCPPSLSNSARPCFSCLLRESGTYTKTWRLKAGLNSHLEELWVFCVQVHTACV